MNKSVWLAGAIIGSTVALAGSPVAAQPSGSPDGYVESKRGGGQITIVRKGRTIAARANTPLYAGDRITVGGSNASVTVRITGRKGRVKVSPRNSPLTVPETEKPGWMARFGQMLSNVGNAIGITDRRTSGHAFARSAAAPVDGILTAEPLTKLGHFQHSSLFASQELSVMAIRWCGDASDVSLTYRGNLFSSINRKDTGFGALDFADFVVSSEGQEYVPDTLTIESLAAESPNVTYSLGWIPLASVPRPQSLVGKTELDAADKLEWGNWLLADEQGELGDAYNLIAFSLLTEVKDDIWLAAYELERASFCPEYTPPAPAEAPADSTDAG